MAVFQDNISKPATANEPSPLFSNFYGRTPNNYC